MPSGPLGGPRPFADEDSVKILVEVTDYDNLNQINFKQHMKNELSDTSIIKNCDYRFVSSQGTVAVNTKAKSVTQKSLNRVVSAVRSSVRASGGGKVKGSVLISTRDFK